MSDAEGPRGEPGSPWTRRRVLAAAGSLAGLGAVAIALLDVDDPDAMVTKFLRYYREVYGRGTLDPTLVEVV